MTRAVNESIDDPTARRAGWSHDWQPRWSQEAGRKPLSAVPCSWQATTCAASCGGAWTPSPGDSHDRHYDYNDASSVLGRCDDAGPACRGVLPSALLGHTRTTPRNPRRPTAEILERFRAGGSSSHPRDANSTRSRSRSCPRPFRIFAAATPSGTLRAVPCRAVPSSAVSGLLFIGRDPSHADEGEAEISNPVEDSVQRRLIWKGAGKNGCVAQDLDL